MKTLFLKINNEISMKKMRCGDIQYIVFVYLLFALNIQLSIYF